MFGEISAISFSSGKNSYKDYPLKVDANTAKKNWVKNQLPNLINPQNSLPPSFDCFTPKDGNGTAAFYG